MFLSSSTNNETLLNYCGSKLFFSVQETQRLLLLPSIFVISLSPNNLFLLILPKLHILHVLHSLIVKFKFWKKSAFRKNILNPSCFAPALVALWPTPVWWSTLCFIVFFKVWFFKPQIQLTQIAAPLIQIRKYSLFL